MDVWLGWRAGERLGEGLARVRSPAGAALMEGKGGLGCYFFWAGREQEDGLFCDDGSLVSERRGGNLSGMGSKHQGEARDSFGNPSSELSSWWILSFQT